MSMQALLIDGWFANGAGGAGSNVPPNILTKFQPIKILMQYRHCFLYFEMSSDPTIVHLPNNIGTLA